MLQYFNLLSVQTEKPKLNETNLNIVFDGNSLTAGSLCSGIDQYFPKEIQTWLTGKVQSLTFNSLGVNSQKITTMVSNGSSNIDTLIDSGKINLIIYNEDANDLFLTPLTAQQNLDKINEYANDRALAGFDYIILWNGYLIRTPYPGFVSQADVERHLDYLNIVKIDVNNNINVKIDMREAPNIGGDSLGQPQDPTYFCDHIHLEAAGYDIVANEIINNGILSIFQL